jgi:hypothetical protein
MQNMMTNPYNPNTMSPFYGQMNQHQGQPTMAYNPMFQGDMRMYQGMPMPSNMNMNMNMNMGMMGMPMNPLQNPQNFPLNGKQ